MNVDDRTVVSEMGEEWSPKMAPEKIIPTITDTTVLSSTFTGADLVDHVRTQFYYAVTVAMVTAGLMLVWGYTRISPFVLLLAGVFALVGLVYGLSALDARRRGIDPEPTRTTGEVAPSDD